jgi:hypothetical protein
MILVQYTKKSYSKFPVFVSYQNTEQKQLLAQFDITIIQICMRLKPN